MIDLNRIKPDWFFAQRHAIGIRLSKKLKFAKSAFEKREKNEKKL
jgi:hypothetical protein